MDVLKYRVMCVVGLRLHPAARLSFPRASIIGPARCAPDLTTNPSLLDRDGPGSISNGSYRLDIDSPPNASPGGGSLQREVAVCRSTPSLAPARGAAITRHFSW